MSQERTWQTAESEEEFITDIVEGALREIGDDNEISNVFQGTEYENGLSEAYDPKARYANPLVDIKHNSLEDKPVPAATADQLKKADTIYDGVATATKSGVKKSIDDDGKNLNDYRPDIIFQRIAGIMEEIAIRIKIRPWGQNDTVFFEDPVYITSVQI
jgi:hypothetical protein